jgi:D-tyrosyl-tRNA(Tyr) deacylase
MRAVVQRVLEASVTVQGEKISSIGAGLLVLLGVGKQDEASDVTWMAEKIAQLRIFEDADGKMNRSLMDTTKSLLAVSQFTLYGDASRGRRPSFIDACEPERANQLYEEFCETSRKLGLAVSRGKFRADMKVALINDGPVTLWLDSKVR